MKLLLSEGSEKQECQIFVFKLGVEESDEKRGTSEVLRERPCSLRWLAATWGTSRISTKYGEKTEYLLDHLQKSTNYKCLPEGRLS